jgi:D-glycero-alpha-D-manno-heptose-7-phosphate kinase
MIISRTPFRISFAGGGSDIKKYYSEHGGAVLSTTIDKYVYLSIHPYFIESKYLLKYSAIEMVNTIEEIQHPLIREIFKKYNISSVDFSSSADIPSGTGLASSSAFAVGLITLCNSFLDKYISKEEIARLACQVEIDILKEPIGKQDQYACAYGGLNFIEFKPDESVIVEKIHLNENVKIELENRLMMFYLGKSRSAKMILDDQVKHMDNDKAQKNLHSLVKLAYDLKKDLRNNNIDTLGSILHDGWMYKKELSNKISDTVIDELYCKALKVGASGGKLLGAGGGGFLLFYVEPEKQVAVRREMKDLHELKFKFDNSGSTIIF